MFIRLFRSMSSLSELQKFTSISIDTSDLSKIQKFAASDATTNPSLILSSASTPEFLEILNKTLEKHKGKPLVPASLNQITDELSVNLGTIISKYVPGYISTEVDPRLSFDYQGTVKRARNIIELYKANGVSKDRVLIKIAATWEGIKAAKVLQGEGINCNMTLIFDKTQAIACGQAGVKLISPFVGRILDWHVKKTGKVFTAQDDPGVVSVKEIYQYFKENGISTIVMGASFRNSQEVLELAGCDKLTISPSLLEELRNSDAKVERKLKPGEKSKKKMKRITMKKFRWDLNANEMANDKLSEGIRKFTEDTLTLHKFIRKQARQLRKSS